MDKIIKSVKKKSLRTISNTTVSKETLEKADHLKSYIESTIIRQI